MAEITLSDLLAWEPRLRPSPANGSSTHLEREVTWAVAARATVPLLPPLRGGELVLLPRRVVAESGVEIAPLLRELAGHGVAAVLLEPEIVPAGRSPLPIVTLSTGPIGPDLEGELNRMLTERRGDLYRAGTELGRVLAGLTTAGATIEQMLSATVAALGIPAAVFDRQGLPLETAGPRAGTGRDEERVTVELVGGERLALGPVGPDARALARMVAERVAVAVEAGLARVARDRPRGPARAAALSAFLTGVGNGSPAAQAAALGLPADASYRVALIAPTVSPGEIQRALSVLGVTHDAGTIDGATALVIDVRGGAPPAGWGKRPKGTGRRPQAGGGWLALSGAERGAASLPETARQARYVAALIREGLIAGPVARFDMVGDIGIYRLLYRSWGTPELAAFAAEALGELPGRDKRGALRKTLLTYLETGGSHVDAAAHLGIHRNTLAYRLKQIATLTGHDPADPSGRLPLHVALLASSLPPP